MTQPLSETSDSYRAAEESTEDHPGSIPLHVAVIMDGNGRWATRQGMPRSDGHRAGTDNIRRITRAFAERGVKYLTLYAFSTENWHRPSDEVQTLIELIEYAILKEVQSLHEQGVRIKHIGRLERLPRSLQESITKSIELTKDNTVITLSVAFNYGGRTEIIDAIKAIAADGIPSDRISEELVRGYLYTDGLPDPDLIVRTACEMRLSNFLIFQSAYSEYYATQVCWPDFDEIEVAKAIEAYGKRKRRFGKVEEQ